jgi:adenosylmethionine---8-amino-7-oxononanoate aminotransferase
MLSDRDFDARHLWHPYTGMITPGPIHEVAEAEGVWLTLRDGTRMIDAMSSWWCAAHGHRHPQLVAAMTAQLQRLPHVMFGGLTHGPAIELGRKLVALLPEGLNRIFYADSGSVAVEVALKMALQAQMARGQTQRTGFASVRGGYHGDTWKAMSLCDPETGMHGHFGAALAPQHFAPAPPIGADDSWSDEPALNGLGAVAALFAQKGAQIAAFILEPVVQGAGGMRFYHPAYLRGLRALCDQHGILLIFDEIATGFGRTGRMFGMDHAAVAPDILCLGKALTGGMMSFAATIASDVVAAAVSTGTPGVLMHGPTFMANPLACAAAVASLDLLATGAWQQQVAAIEAQLRAELAPARTLPGVADLRILGAIGVIEMREPLDIARVHAFARPSGVYLRPFGRLLYTMPPYITTPGELRQIIRSMLDIAGWS